MATSALKHAKRIVFKVGTSTLTYENGKLNLLRVEKLARVLCDLRNSGKDIVLVSSGAIAVGVAKLAAVNGRRRFRTSRPWRRWGRVS